MFVGSRSSSVVSFLFVLSVLPSLFGQPPQQPEPEQQKPKQQPAEGGGQRKFPIYRYTSPNECGQDEYFDSIGFICRKCSTRLPELLKNSEGLSFLGGYGVECACPKEYRLEVIDKKLICLKGECPNEGEIKINGSCGKCREKDCQCPAGHYLDRVGAESEGKPRELVCRRCEFGQPHCGTCHVSYFLSSDELCTCPGATHVEEDGMCLPKDKLINEDTLRALATIRRTNFVHISSELSTTLRGSIFNCLNAKNITACQHLLNQCVLKFFTEAGGESYEERMGLCNLLSRMSQQQLEVTIDANYVGETVGYRYRAQDVLDLVLVQYARNGSLVLQPTTPTRLQLSQLFLCHNDTLHRGQSHFGVALHKRCTWTATQLWHYATTNDQGDGVFFELYLVGEEKRLLLLPVRAHFHRLLNRYIYFRRFPLLDSHVGIDRTSGKRLYIVYAQSVVIRVQMSRQSAVGRIHPPIINIDYRLLESNHREEEPITTEVKVIYWKDNDQLDFELVVATYVFVVLCLAMAAGRTWIWYRRSEERSLLITLVVFVVKFLGYGANILMFVTLSVLIGQYVGFKYQTIMYVTLFTEEQENDFIVYLVIAFIFKLTQLLYELFRIVSIDIFFIDWEKPKKERNDKSADSQNVKRTSTSATVVATRKSNGTSNDINNAEVNNVTIWRSYLVANEWYELSLCRRVNWSLHVVALILCFEYFSTPTRSSSAWHESSKWIDEIPESRNARIAYGSMVFIVLAAAQYLFQKFYNENFRCNRFNNFMDLCSVSNISVFCLRLNKHGFYLHGCSPNGKSDVNMLDMYDFLENEESDLCSKRGLRPNTDEQTFEVYLPSSVHDHWLQLRRGIDKRLLGGGGHSTPRLRDLNKETVVNTYTHINRFLTCFIEHNFPKADYSIAEKSNWESLLDFERENLYERGYFYQDTQQIIECALLYGLESTLLIFELLTFLISDLVVNNFIIASIVTFLVVQLLQHVYARLAKRNLVKRTLMDERFLI